MIDILVGLLSITLLFFLPGFMIVLILYPKRDALSKEFDLLFKVVLGIAFSIVISIIVGMILYGIDWLVAPPDVQSQRLWIILTLISISLGAIAFWRGGFGFVLSSKVTEGTPRDNTEEELDRLAAEKKSLQEKILMLDSKEYQENQALKNEAAVRIPLIRKDIEKINEKIDKMISEEPKAAEGGKAAEDH